MDCKGLKSRKFKLNAISYIILTAFTHESALYAATPGISHHNNPVIAYDINTIYEPRFTFNGQGGSYGFGQLDVMYPFIRREGSLFMIDGRFERGSLNAEDGNLGYNLGLVYRQLMNNNNNILGAYLWLDRSRSPQYNYYNQATIGGEYLGATYDFRGNVYVPYGQTTQQLSPTYTGQVLGHTLIAFRHNFNEEALPGFDIEMGRDIPGIKNLRAFADYYHFGVGDDTKVDGGRARFEYFVNYNFTATASYAYDNISHSVGFIGFRASIGGVDQSSKIPMHKRMEDFIIRNADVVRTKNTLHSNVFINPQKYWFVDNTALPGGNGTFQRPFNTEAQAEAAAGAGDAIYTFRGTGIYALPGGGLNLKPNQFFTGSGGDLIFHHAIIIPGTVAPVMNGRINLANGTTLSNFIVSGTGTGEITGIYGNGVSNVILSNLTIQDFSGTNANGADSKGSNTDQVGGNGGVGGNITGMTIINSNHITIENTTVKNITGGDANGGNATTYVPDNINNTYRAHGGTGGTGGNATGIDLSDSSAILINVTVTGIRGGSANGGDGNVIGIGANSYNNWAYGNNAGTGGNATGINLAGSTGSTLNSVTVTGISGGSAIGGDASGLSGTSTASYNYGLNGSGGLGGAAEGIALTNGSATLSKVIVSNITGGSADAGDTFALGASTSLNHANTTNIAGTGGSAIGMDLTNSNVTLSHVTVSVSGGSANGGDATATGSTGTNTGNASNGGNGGNATGIIETGATVINVGPVNVTATGGSANGGTGTTSSGAAGTPGTGTNIIP